ncbi:MAG: hypothetical protein PF483_11330 [Halothiobacillus sp.]|jgi:hypothetical protein|nr:hypothetical protein [Halothiobacillus sp.]
MTYPRFLHYVILLLAVWFPLDNALAGAVVEGCPMMSHAFEQGLSATARTAPNDGYCLPSHQVASADHSQSTAMNQCGDHCCDLCLLFGGAALTLPIQHKVMLIEPLGQSAFFDFHAANRAVHAPPLYRPPIA